MKLATAMPRPQSYKRKKVFHMLFAKFERCLYTRSPLVEVICQLRFPAILSIGSGEPAEFQEAVRHDFPRYAARQERPAPKISGLGGPNPTVEPQPPITNYHFISEDGHWKLNLTQNFISLSTLAYPRWEEFARRLDKPLAAFIATYHPDFFERIGLRYVNAVSRQRLGLTDLLWDDLIQSPYLGILGEPDVDEKAANKCAVDIETRLSDGSRLKLHAGPGLLGGGKKDPEPKFILDQDLSSAGQITAEEIPQRLDQLHQYAGGLFHGAITDELHEAMGPVKAD